MRQQDERVPPVLRQTPGPAPGMTSPGVGGMAPALRLAPQSFVYQLPRMSNNINFGMAAVNFGNMGMLSGPPYFPDPLFKPALAAAPPMQMSASTPYSSSSSSSSSGPAPQLPRYIYNCHLCEKSFKRRSWLKRHMLAHSTQRQFQCPHCLSKHKRKDNLLQHMKLKHMHLIVQELIRTNGLQSDPTSVPLNLNDDVKSLLANKSLKKKDIKRVLDSLIEKQNPSTSS